MNFSFKIKTSDLKQFNNWLKTMCTIDKRLTVEDLPKLYALYKRSEQ